MEYQFPYLLTPWTRRLWLRRTPLEANTNFQQVGDMQRIARTYGQLGMVAEEREDVTGALEWVGQTYRLATDHNLPVLPQVESHLARLKSKLGEESFNDWWRGFMGSDPPTNLNLGNMEQDSDEAAPES